MHVVQLHNLWKSNKALWGSDLCPEGWNISCRFGFGSKCWRNIFVQLQLSYPKTPEIKIFSVIVIIEENFDGWCDLTVSSPQGGRAGDPHPDPEHRGLLRPVWRGEVCHPVRAGGLLHSGERHPAGQGRHHHRAQIPPQLLRPHHREVCVLFIQPLGSLFNLQ